ncbi:hypothetical protein J6590_003540 [Homalodisca vitripennis]|nr:hypothetical protein J6590_003540 [Homalodisca vitripennis]
MLKPRLECDARGECWSETLDTQLKAAEQESLVINHLVLSASSAQIRAPYRSIPSAAAVPLSARIGLPVVSSATRPADAINPTTVLNFSLISSLPQHTIQTRSDMVSIDYDCTPVNKVISNKYTLDTAIFISNGRSRLSDRRPCDRGAKPTRAGCPNGKLCATVGRQSLTAHHASDFKARHPAGFVAICLCGVFFTLSQQYYLSSSGSCPKP